MKNAINIVREIQSANPTGLRSLFMRYNIGAEPTPRNVVLAIMAFGDAFTEELYALYPGKATNYTGTDYSTMESGLMDFGLINYDSPIFAGTNYTQQKFDLSGNAVTSPATSATKKKFSLDGFKDIFNNVANMVGTGANVYNTVKTGKTVQTAEQQQADQQLLSMQMLQEQAGAKAKTQQIYIVGAVLVAVVLIGIFIFRRK